MAKHLPSWCTCWGGAWRWSSEGQIARKYTHVAAVRETATASLVLPPCVASMLTLQSDLLTAIGLATGVTVLLQQLPLQCSSSRQLVTVAHSGRFTHVQRMFAHRQHTAQAVMCAALHRASLLLPPRAPAAAAPPPRLPASAALPPPVLPGGRWHGTARATCGVGGVRRLGLKEGTPPEVLLAAPCQEGGRAVYAAQAA